MTLVQVADWLGVNQHTVGYNELGRYIPTKYNLEGYSELYDVPWDVLVAACVRSNERDNFRVSSQFSNEDHGTRREADRHLRRGEEMCPACLKAWREYYRLKQRDYNNKLYAKGLTAKGTPPKNRRKKPCGTDAGYHWHLYHNETPCQPCKQAAQTKGRERRTKVPRRTGQSGFWGVRARIDFNNTSSAPRHMRDKPWTTEPYVGVFADPKEAALARDAEVKRLGLNMRLNHFL